MPKYTVILDAGEIVIQPATTPNPTAAIREALELNDLDAADVICVLEGWPKVIDF